ncbi:MAG: universal stress protein, partial [Deltaproteobacteria bacterium]|nr:universal stress protein [Deltaproteobacteria bacterium]
MDKIRKILAPTDFSELSQVGVRYALEMAESLGAEVIIYHVVGIAEEWLASHDEFYSVKEFVEEQKKMMDELLRENFADILSQVTIRAQVEVGVPHKMIVEKAVEERADIIVMSTHGKSGLSRMIIGSVTEKVVGRAPCPV